VIAAIKRWLIAQGFTARAAVLAMWQAGILLFVLVLVLVMRQLRK
jgi:hypothetical protein